ncbi:MAG: diaminopimelate decarboxylase [Spirochaetaceae bacterium]|jgi:diaminopimelate decarboxylase|nr:diaminopimelate decarboxylase [Spirochaetaceae bacterium]
MNTTNSKSFPLSKKDVELLSEKYPTPFYLYDEAAIRANARRLKEAFSVFPAIENEPGYIEHFAVKALPNPAILKILADEGFGADCSSLPELLLADMAGIKGEKIMLTSNETPAEEYKKAFELGAIINLDDISHIEFLEKALISHGDTETRRGSLLPSIICVRYNPGPLKGGNAIIGKPEEAKYGLTREQVFEAYRILQAKGVKRFGLHCMVASNELNIDYHFETALILFELAAEVKERLGISLEFINLGGGVGIPYRPEDTAIDWKELAQGIKKLYDDIWGAAGLNSIQLRTEYGRPITGPYGWLVTKAIHHKDIYRKYIGVDATMADLMRPALYGAYHHITVLGKEDAPLTETYDVVGSLCENNDKFAIRRPLPKIDEGDILAIHDAGAHGRAMGFNYNGKLRCGELLLKTDGSVEMIRRRETVEDYFATLKI